MELEKKDIIKYAFERTKIRIIVIESDPWFIAKDVFKALNISWKGDESLNKIPNEWKMVRNYRTGKGTRNFIFINEAGVFKLAFRSNKEEADNFTNWVACEVLPSLRKTGRYEIKNIDRKNESDLSVERELTAAKISMEILGLSQASKVKMLDSILSDLNCNYARKALPNYVEDESSISLTEVLKQNNINLSARKVYPILIDFGLVEIRTRKSKTKGIKKFYSLTDKGKEFGKNQTCPASPNQTQVHFYRDKVVDLLNHINIINGTI